MPEKVHECVQSVLDDNPDMGESRAWAICQAEMQAAVDDVEVATTDTLGSSPSDMDTFAQQATGWEKQADGVWANEEEQYLVYDEAVADQQAGEFAVDVFRIVQSEDSEMDLDGDLMGIGVDFPNAGVYVDWRIDAWPDDEQLDEPHVSDYGTIDDLEQATGGVVEPLTTVDAEATGSDLEGQAGSLPPECRKCGEHDRMEGAMVCADCADDGADQQLATPEQQAEVDAVTLHFPPGGEVIDHEEGDWDQFLDDLSKHGDVFQMWKGLQRHPEDTLESHDHPTYVALEADSDVTDIEDVLDDHPAVDYVINPGSIPVFSKPEGWDPEDSDHVPMAEQQG
ncbi:hypothetical protein [Haloarcula pellucida]|uniref:Uncharacterized protein n=1 Tax=Haloarcula pellucida TaxID=1427151 RepID=A0A830GT54_9EURY|nr:hypothetical protein [Halomicroarcula pellucida]MBX0350484.1 hypothetical protein [Halomicroarcula pellucida]GGO03537.1 hypothetical protein GCM10009030_39300 [Halomicroarcula pellucida]